MPLRVTRHVKDALWALCLLPLLLFARRLDVVIHTEEHVDERIAGQF